MKYLFSFLSFLIFNIVIGEKSDSTQSINSLNQNLQHDSRAENLASVHENLVLTDYNEYSQESTNTITNPQFVRVKYFSNTTQAQINESLENINPINHLRCADDPYVYVIYLVIQGNGRGRGSAGTGGTDNVIHGGPHVQNYKVGRMCD